LEGLFNDQWLLINFYYIGVIKISGGLTKNDSKIWGLFNDQWSLINFYYIGVIKFEDSLMINGYWSIFTIRRNTIWGQTGGTDSFIMINGY